MTQATAETSWVFEDSSEKAHAFERLSKFKRVS